MQRPEGEYQFFNADRERIKGASMLPTETLRYIEALEAVAKAGLEVWRNTPHTLPPPSIARECLNDLYDALSIVNFLDEDV